MRTVTWVDLPPDVIGPTRTRRYRDFEVDGAGYFMARNDAFWAPLEVVEEASLTSLMHAYRRYARSYGGDPLDPTSLYLRPVPAEVFDYEFGPQEDVSLNVSADTVAATVFIGTADLPEPEHVWNVLDPLLDRRGARPASFEGYDGVVGAAIEVGVAVPPRGRTVADALAIGREVEQLLTAAFSEGPELTPATVADLLRTGHGHVLAGQPENGWLDVKSRDYELSSDHGKLAFSKDVASFANAGRGVIAIGLTTSRTRRGELIGGLRPIDITGVTAQRYRRVLHAWVHPRVAGLRVDIVESGSAPSRGIVVIEIPTQSPAAIPFIVKKADIAGRVRNHHFTIPVRVADDTAAWDIGEIHTLIVAGRAALGATATPEPPQESGSP